MRLVLQCTGKRVIRKTKAKRLLKLLRPATHEARDGNNKLRRTTVTAEDVFYSSPKTFNFCCIINCFHFYIKAIETVSNFSLTTKGKASKPYSECGKKKKKPALND